MSRISQQALSAAVQKIHAMSAGQKEQLADELFHVQPNMLASFLVQKQLGVSLEKMEFLVDVLFICFQAMKESGLPWPLITEDEQDKQMARYVGITNFGRDLSSSLQILATKQYIESHPEPLLFAFVSVELNDWLARVAPEETDKYVVLTAMNLVNCIAFVPIPALTPAA
jgi:hypothetical protein